MEPNEKNRELVGLYLQGRLEGEGLSSFLKAVQGNDALKEELNIQQAILEGIEYKNNRELRTRLNKIAEESKISKTETKIFSMRFLKIMSSVAAIGLLCFAAYFLLNKTSDTDAIYAKYFEPSELTITRSTDLESDLVIVNELYNTKKYDKSLPIFKKIIAKNPTSSNLRLAYGSALLKCTKTNLAREQFTYIIDSKDPLFSDQSGWYLALLELKESNIEETKENLSFLIEDSNSDFYLEAQSLLKELEGLE